jgi:hypothetical protein
MTLEMEGTKKTWAHFEPTKISLFGDISFVSKGKIQSPLEKLENAQEKPCIDDLIEGIVCWAHGIYGQNEFANGFQEFQNLTGRIFYDEECYHQRVNYFLHYFVFQRVPSEAFPIIPYQAFIGSPYFENCTIKEETKQRILDLIHHIHSLFLVQKIQKDRMVLKDLLHENKTLICNDLDFYGMVQGSIIQGFLFPKEDLAYHLSPGTIIHPKAVSSLIKKTLKNSVKDSHPKGSTLLSLFGKQNLNFVRRRHLDAKKIYLSKET